MTGRLHWIGALLVVLTLVAYAPMRSASEFIYEDAISFGFALENGHIVVHQPWRFLTVGRDLSRLSMYAAAKVVDASPQTQRAVNLLLHLLNGLALIVLADILTGNVWVGVLAAAIFLGQPIQAEAVNLIASRPDVLGTLCLLVTLIAALTDASLVTLFLLGLLSLAAKQTNLALVILLPLTLWAGGRDWRRVLPLCVGWLLLAARPLYMILSTPTDTDVPLPYTLFWTAAYQSYAFWHTVWSFLTLSGFSLDHQYGLAAPAATVCTLLLTLSVGVWGVWRSPSRYDTLAVGWPLLLLAPRLLLHLPEFFNEHQFYSMMPAICLGLAARLVSWATRPFNPGAAYASSCELPS